jgi:hypothetical protein
MSGFHQKHREANMLIDLLFCMGASSALLLVAIEFVHRSFATSRDSSSRSQIVNTIHRLDLQFRRDMNAATAVFEESDTETVVSHDKGRVVYTLESNKIQRRRSGSSGDLENELFAMPEGAKASLELDRKSGFAILRVVVPRDQNRDRVLLNCVASWRSPR